MKKQKRVYPITPASLIAYQVAAFSNAAQLLDEAKTLLAASHYARAYFLAEAAIEEVGKAALAYLARARNLESPGVVSRLRIEFEDHRSKIVAAFAGQIRALGNSQSVKEDLQNILSYFSSLSRGREASMYADFRKDGTCYAPADVVKPSVASDCLRLATHCYARTALMFRNEPQSFSAAEDKLYALGPKALKVWEQEDFGWYLLDHVEKNGIQTALSEAVTVYHDAYLSKGRKFKIEGDA